MQDHQEADLTTTTQPTSAQDLNSSSKKDSKHALLQPFTPADTDPTTNPDDKALNSNWRDEMKAEKKKQNKKKRKNKKKGLLSPSGSAHGDPSHSHHPESAFDKTQSTVGAHHHHQYNGAPPHSKKDYAEDHKSDDFTPLKDKLGASFFEDQDSSEDEGMPDYKIGGYHPVHVGEILLDRYVIIQKLGWGHFSTVWLTKDLKYNNYVAMKVQKSAQHYLEAAYDEVEILDQVASNWKTEEWKKSIDLFYKDDEQLKASLAKYGMSGDTSHCAQLLNSFIHHGPNGKHFVMVFEILGVNFLEIIKRYDYKGVPMPLVRKLARQCLIGLDYMHRMCKMIHTDFKPENVVICLRDDEVQEIAKTGQLTTTKMFENASTLKKINMKVAGTLKPPMPTTAEQVKEMGGESRQSEQNMEGLTAKQRKNQKKKQKKKEKKQQVQQEEEPKKEEEEKVEVMNDISNQQQEQSKKKKQAKKGSLDATKEPIMGSLLLDEEEQLEQLNKKQKRRGPKIDENVQVKICDMGNGCWTYHHFTPEIQTRQYRSPEVIIGADYDTSADVWSFACTIFEMITGDFLFEPRKGQSYDKDDDHLAQMMELLGRMPNNMALSGKNSKKYFDSNGHLKKISGLNYWPLKKVLMEKYKIREGEAQAMSDFLVPMLEWYPNRRATAKEMLGHYWLNMEANYDYKYSDREYEIMLLKKQVKETNTGGDKAKLDDSVQEMNELVESDEELNAGDCERDTDYDEEKIGCDSDSASLWDSDEDRKRTRKRKAEDAKVEKRKLDEGQNSDGSIDKTNTFEEIKARKIFKAVKVHTPDTLNQQQTRENSDTTEQARGQFSLIKNFTNSSIQMTTPQPQLTFNFNLQKVEENSKTQEEIKEDVRESKKLLKRLKLNDEKKIFICQDLFTSSVPLIQATKPKDVQEENKKQSQEQKANIVEENPLNSSLSLQQQKQALIPNNESPIAKSLFDFKENEQYKNSDFFSKNKQEDQKDQKKPAFAAPLSFSNPFLKDKVSNIFTQGSLFGKPQGMFNPFLNTAPPFNSESQNKEEDEEDKLEPEEKEQLVSNNKQYEKLYQKQIHSIKLMKGVCAEDGQPSKKLQGYLSLERMKTDQGNAPVHMVFRNFVGATLFTSILNRTISKVKEEPLDAGRPKFKCKVAVLCNLYKSKEYKPEHVVVRFNLKPDLHSFIEIFQKQLSEVSNNN